MRTWVITIVLVALLASCNQVDFTATSGATLKLFAQPMTVDRNQVSTLTVTGTRSNGAPLADGTVVRFTVGGSSGDVTPNSVELRNGVAVSHFVAGSTTGDAMVTAFSGSATVNVTITIAKPTPTTIIVTADPTSLPIGGGRTTLRAFVFDVDGIPIGGVKLFFQTDNGSLASHGLPVVTNNSGLATDTLDTTATAHVTVTSSTGATGMVTVNVTAGQSPTCGFTITPGTSVTIGQQVFFLDTTSDPNGTIVTSTWDFGDGSSGQGISTTHSYSAAGTFFVIHSITDDQGFSATCSPQTITVS